LGDDEKWENFLNVVAELDDANGRLTNLVSGKSTIRIIT